MASKTFKHFVRWWFQIWLWVKLVWRYLKGSLVVFSVTSSHSRSNTVTLFFWLERIVTFLDTLNLEWTSLDGWPRRVELTETSVCRHSGSTPQRGTGGGADGNNKQPTCWQPCALTWTFSPPEKGHLSAFAWNP